MLVPNNPLLMGLTAGQCWQSCTTPNSTQGCRAGYVCTTVGMVTGNNTPGIPQLAEPVCLPLLTGDGGGGDSGADVVDASGIDASST